LNACISEFLGLLQDVAKLHEADYLKTFHMLKILNARFRRAGLLMYCLVTNDESGARLAGGLPIGAELQVHPSIHRKVVSRTALAYLRFALAA
jgi:hypothetical protein